MKFRRFCQGTSLLLWRPRICDQGDYGKNVRLQFPPLTKSEFRLQMDAVRISQVSKLLLNFWMKFRSFCQGTSLPLQRARICDHGDDWKNVRLQFESVIKSAFQLQIRAVWILQVSKMHVNFWMKFNRFCQATSLLRWRARKCDHADNWKNVCLRFRPVIKSEFQLQINAAGFCRFQTCNCTSG